MTTTAATNSAHVQASDIDVYDPDAVVPQNSPLLVPTRVNVRPSPSPPPDIPLVQVSPPPSPGGGRKTKRRRKVRPSQGDAVLVGIMDSGRRPEIASMAGKMALPSDTSEGTSSPPDSDSSGDEDERGQAREDGKRRADNDCHKDDGPPDTSSLQSLAVGAMVALGLGSDTSRTPTTVDGMDVEASPAAATSPDGSVRKDDRPQPLVPSPSFSPPGPGPYSPRNLGMIPKPGLRSPTGSMTGHRELPPIQNASPRSETNSGQMLPSIRDHLGDMRNFAPDPLSPAFSPPGPGVPGMPRLPSLSHASPPISPRDVRDARDAFTRPLVLPGPVSPYHTFPVNGMYRSANAEYNSSNTQTPSSDHSVPTPASSTHSVAERMNIDGLAYANPAEAGAFVCKFEGCKAPPFQTQYLLNSHANVHSSARPHYCPVKGCPRSEGGKGFKRKNEMIRHGLVHESPGYVCPFCPDREHKYPRPDNLQRHVRVHHVDKDKDDPQLREVLSQRPDGPSRGRRRRGGPN